MVRATTGLTLLEYERELFCGVSARGHPTGSVCTGRKVVVRGRFGRRRWERHHEIVSEAILRRINDPRVSPLTTVTRVQLSGDLFIATVYLSVSGEAAVERRTMTAMRHAAGFIRGMVAHEIGLRQCPELRFEVDETLKKVKQTMQLLDENRRNKPTSSRRRTRNGTDSGVAGPAGGRLEELRRRKTARLRRGCALCQARVGPDPAILEPGDPIRRLAIAVLGWNGDAEPIAIDRLFRPGLERSPRVRTEQVYRAIGDRVLPPLPAD
jgi:ribosome-binding factor A